VLFRSAKYNFLIISLISIFSDIVFNGLQETCFNQQHYPSIGVSAFNKPTILTSFRIQNRHIRFENHRQYTRKNSIACFQADKLSGQESSPEEEDSDFASVPRTLNEKTKWRVKMNFQNDENQLNSEAIVQIRFIEDRNYEPPQGRCFIENDFNGLVKADSQGYSGFWTLSEDKDDRRDGLWIWGLFEEPKYPFLYFYLDIYDTIILDSEKEINIRGEKGGIPGNRLNFRFDHSRIKEKGGVVLRGGKMTYKISEYIKADPFGVGGQVDVGDIFDAGAVDIRPVFSEEE